MATTQQCRLPSRHYGQQYFAMNLYSWHTIVQKAPDRFLLQTGCATLYKESLMAFPPSIEEGDLQDEPRQDAPSVHDRCQCSFVAMI